MDLSIFIRMGKSIQLELVEQTQNRNLHCFLFMDQKSVLQKFNERSTRQVVKIYR